VALLGLTGVVGYHYFFFLAVRHTVLANAAILNSLNPVLTAILAAWLLGERLTRVRYAGIGVAFAGAVLLVVGGDPAELGGLVPHAGDLAMLLATTSWAIYAVTVRALAVRYDGFVLTFHSMAGGVALLVPLALLEPLFDDLRRLSPAAVAAVLYMGIGASGVGYLLYNAAIRRAGPTVTAAVVQGVVPFLVAVLARVVLGEPLTGGMAASALLVLAGVGLVLAPFDRGTGRW
jgi:drug/metabolite transporter (DMT)-like permease